MLVATWNVNSIRTRLNRVLSWLKHNNIDIAALQETKCKDVQFPYEPFIQAGYFVAHYGLSQWNGVAVISRKELTDITKGFPHEPGFIGTGNQGSGSKTEARAIGVTCGNLRLWSVYIPNGRDLDNPHYTYKLDWLDKFREYIIHEMQLYPYIILGGDWNIAPYDEDVWDITAFEGKTHISTPERERFHAFIDSGFYDPVRPLTPGEYTYWDYTQLRFPKGQGMRIDYSLLSPELRNYFKDAKIDRIERKGQGASDHAPILVNLSLK